MKLPFQLDRPLVFFDLETTGLDLKNDRIIEIAFIKWTPHGDILERERRFNPGMPIPPGATAVHGITDEDVANAVEFCRVARSLVEMLEGCDLAGFNVRRFAGCQPAGVQPSRNRFLDAARASQVPGEQFGAFFA